MTNEHPVHVFGNGDLAKLMRKSVDVSSNFGVKYNPENFPDQQPTVSSPVQTNSSRTAISMLEEATKLKDRADHYKNYGFDFESNEMYFEAALKFLHGASLLENCRNESSKHREMSKAQIYASAAKLFNLLKEHRHFMKKYIPSRGVAYEFNLLLGMSVTWNVLLVMMEYPRFCRGLISFGNLAALRLSLPTSFFITPKTRTRDLGDEGQPQYQLDQRYVGGAKFILTQP